MSDPSEDIAQDTSSDCVQKVAIFVCFLNAGNSTRGVEIAKAIREVDETVEIRFFSWKGPASTSFDSVARKAGFNITHHGPPIDQETWNKILEAEQTGKHRNVLQDKNRNIANIRGAIEAMKVFRPDVVVHSIVPDAPIAAHILHIPNILFVPIPSWDRQWILSNIYNDIPDSQASWWTDLLPLWVRQAFLKLMFRLMRTPRTAIVEAAQECGWTGRGPLDVYKSDYYLLADLPTNYVGETFQSNVRVIGPLYAGSFQQTGILPTDIENLLSSNDTPKVFVTMGSTGGRYFVVEAVKAVCAGRLSAVIALAPGLCGIEEIRESVGSIPDRVILTEEFLPANKVASLVDVVIGHGGQGTVQTALASGIPIVGVAMQCEQQFNLDNVARRGAAIRIPKREWKADEILNAVNEILSNKDTYKQAAKKIQEEILSTNSAMEAARLVLDV